MSSPPPPAPRPMVISMPAYRPPEIKPDPNIGLAALKQADLVEDRLDWEKELKKREEEQAQARKDSAVQDLFGYNYALGEDLNQNLQNNSGPAGYVGNLVNQVRSGILTYDQANQRLQDFSDKNDLVGYTSAAQQQLQSSWDEFNQDTFGRRAARQYELLVGKPLDLQAMNVYSDEFASDYGYDVNTFVNDVLNSKEYKEQFNDNYLDQYYDIEYGKAVDPETGDVKIGSGQRTFNFGNLGEVPEFPKIDIEGADFKIPGTPGTDGKFTGTIQEIKQAQQERNQQLNFYYNSGLTALQGNIDKNIQELKNKGAKEVAQISRSASTMAAALGQV